MKNQITQQQIDTYREQGFLAIPNFFEADEVMKWREATEDAVTRRLNRLQSGLQSGEVKKSFSQKMKAPIKAVLGKNAGIAARNAARAVLGKKLVPVGFSGVLNTNQGDKDSYYAQVYVQCIRLAFEHPVMRELIIDERIGEVVGKLAGVDGVRLYHDQALFKPALGNPTAWHLDNPYWSFYSKQSVTMWVAIEDATMENGCMWYVPGSHKTATYDRNLPISENFSGIFKMYPEWKDINPVAVPVPAGSVVFHSGMTAHGAGVNMTRRPRRAYACAYMPDGSTFNGNKDVLEDEYFKSLKEGDVLNNDSVHPLLWSKHRKATLQTSGKLEPAMA